MSRSEQTMLRLADALKELTVTMPFCKISVSHIAEQAGMSRKSFYYHFKDKYDLVSFIFDSEFAEYRSHNGEGTWLKQLCSYLYAHRDFYRSVLQYEGQNCFEDQLRHSIWNRATEVIGAPVKEDPDCERLMAEAMLAMLKTWLTDTEVMDAETFIKVLHRAVAFITGASTHCKTV